VLGVVVTQLGGSLPPPLGGGAKISLRSSGEPLYRIKGTLRRYSKCQLKAYMLQILQLHLIITLLVL